jgi:outer membrane protein TolC
MIRYPAALAFVLLPIPVFAQAPPPQTITLKDALALAEKIDPQLLSATTDAEVARQDREQARTLIYPAASVRSEFLGTQGNGQIPTSRFVTNDGVHVYREWAVVHQDFSPGTWTRVGVRHASAVEAVARAKAELARRGIIPTVTKSYYSLLAAQRKYAIEQQALDQAQRALTISQDLERGGEVAHSDVVKSELQVNAQQQGLNDAQLAMESARLDLAVLLFRDFNENFSIVDDLELAPALPSLADAETMASRENPALGVAIQTLRAASLDITLARQQYLPTIMVDAIYGIEANAILLNSIDRAFQEKGPVPTPGYFIDASLNFPLWDWGVRRSRVRQARFKHEQAQTDLSATQRNMIKSLHAFYDEAQTARRQLDLLRTALDLASESLRLNTLRYQAGEATILELVDAENVLIQARNAYDDGMVRYRLAIANLQTVTGVF